MSQNRSNCLLNIMIIKKKSECNSTFFYDFMYNGYCWRYGEISPALIYRRFIFETRSVGGVLPLTAYNAYFRCSHEIALPLIQPLIRQNQANQADFAPFLLLFSICPIWQKKFFLGKICLICLILAFVFSSSSSIYIIYISLLLWKKTVITTVVKVVYIGVGSSHCNPLLSFFLHSWLLDVERNVSLLFCTLFHSTITNSFSLFTCKPLRWKVWIRIIVITWKGVTCDLLWPFFQSFSWIGFLGHTFEIR